MISDHSVSAEQHGRRVAESGATGSRLLVLQAVYEFPWTSGVVKMPRYYFYCVNTEGRFAFGKQIEAEDIAAAIRIASAESRAHPAGPFQGLEVWQDARCLFSSESLLRTTRLRNRRDRNRGSHAGALPRNPDTP
jgi:hypothetical protein